MRIISFLAFLLFSNSAFAQDYFENRLFIKIKDEHRSVYSLENDVRFDKILPRALVKSLLPVSKHPLLSSTYELILNENYALDSLVAKIQQLEQIEYVEKVPLYKLFFTPNDPLYSTQWNLAKIQADLAWNLGQGCTQVKIAVTDDGFLMNHEDLVNQWHINTGEINGNGIDDDGNGYIDDWRGWDAANNDNDPSATAPTNSFFTHGTHVAGIVAAQTHNNKGIAAIGYNCKMIPVKIGLSPSSSLTGAFQGLDYAINASGCDVINMSWGGGAWSATFQTLFNIAKSKGIICVAAAGNSNTSTPMYPASYNHVISVAASGSTDARASFSNFGSTIDVTAPGVGIPSCLAGSITSYGNLSGTSMASPLVAGLCGLMKCYNPMPADSIEACLKRTCDNINAQNPTFIGQLGAGRVNAFQALQCLTKKPKSDFIALDTFQCPTKAVRYQAKSFGIPTLTYSWSFPGGSPATSTSANPIVTYATAGYKSATLITCNSLGCDTMTKTNYVNIDTPKAWLNNRVYTTINAMNVAIAVHFKGRPPFSVTLTDGSNTWTQTNIQSNPYLFSIQPKKDTSILSISSFSDSSCAGNKYGQDTIYRKLLTKDTTICVTLKTSQSGAIDLMIAYNTTGASTYFWSDVSGEFTTERWTSSGTPTSTDGIMKYNLTNIPSNAIINSAFISLYANSSVANWSGQPTAGTNNAATLSRVTSSWNVGSYPTTYPSFSTTNQVNLSQTPTTNSNHINIDVKNLIQDIINSGSNNGILFKMNTNSFYNALQMHSRQSTDTSKHPKLVLCYTIPAGSSGGGEAAFCRDSLEVNSAQTGWQALQTNGTWGSLTSCNYVTSLFTANAANFPGMNIGNCLWGPIVANPSRTYYNSSSQTSTSTSNADIAVFRKEISIPVGALIDSVRLWMLSDDFVDSVFINSKNIYTTPIPITYGQVLFTKKEVNIGSGLATNYITIKAGDLGGNYGHYFRAKVYYSQSCVKSSCRDSIIYYTDTSNWFYQNTSGAWVKATLGINSCGQVSHAWSPINLIGIQNGNQMIWGNTTSATCNLKRDIVIPDVSKVDSIRVLVQADDNIVAFKVNGTFVTSTPFGWNNTSSVLISKSLLVNGNNTFNIEGTNANGSCAWVAMKMIIYKDTCKTTTQDCDTTGLILCMSMDGNANDSTKYNHHGIVSNATLTTGRNGVANSAYYFNGTSSHISLGVKPMLKPSSASISVWVKPHTFNSYTGGNANCILLTKNPNNPGSYMEAYSLYLTNRSGPTKFMTISTHQPTTNEKWFLSNQNTSLNQWTHLVLTFDYDSLKLYINGQLDNKTYKGFNNVYDALDSIMIGYSANTMNKNYFKGDMDELKMYNRVLTSSEVQNLYSKPFRCSCTSSPPPSDCDTSQLNTGKVLHLDFNGNTQDKSGNNNHATNYGATPVAGKDGVANTAYRFDSTNYMSVAHHSSLNLRSFTITAILKPLKFNTNLCYGNNIISKGANGAPGQWALIYGPADAGTSCVGRDTNLNNFLFCGNTCQASWYIKDTPYMKHDKWNCIVTSYDSISKVAKMYVDGKLRHQWTTTWDLLTSSNTLDVLIGKYAGINYPYYIQAVIDDIRIYNRVLAPAEVKGYCGTCNSAPPPPSDCDTSGLVLCMSMDGNANDSTKYAHHGIVRGATPTANRFGINNSAYSFNGISNYISLGNKSLLKPNKATISMWVKPNSISTSGYGYQLNPLFVTGNTNSPGNMCEAYFMGISTNGNTKFHSSSWNPSPSVSSGGFANQSFSLNAWHHMTTTFDNDSLKIYINGVLDKSFYKGFATNYSTIDSIIIAYSGNNTNNQRWFNGSIDDIKMFNRVLTAAEVQNLYSKPFTCSCTSSPPPSDCDTSQLNTGKVLHLDFNGNTQDKSGNNNHATNYGATAVADRFGNPNSAYRFNGSTSKMIISNFPTSSSNNLSLSIWFKSNSTSQSSYAGLLDHSHSNGGIYQNWVLQHYQTNKKADLGWRISASAWSNTDNTGPTYDNTKWNHLVAIKNSDTLTYYLNCIKIYSNKFNGTQNILKQVADLNIGFVASWNRYFNGDIDDIRIYHRVLNDQEIKALGDCCSTTTPPPPCDTAQKLTFTQCLNDSLQVTLRAGSQYQWSPKLGLSSDTVRNPKIYVTANQRYLVSYMGTKGCQVIDTIDISVRPSAIYPKMEDQLICIGDSVQMTIPIYATNVQWSPNTNISSITANNPFFYPTVNTTYYLQFRDTFGCLHKDTFVVNTKVCCPARARFSIPKELLCFGEDLTITNRSKGPITGYNWNFSNANPNSFAGANPPVLKFPAGGTYPLRLIVTNGICFDTMTKIVTVVQVFPNAGKDTTNCLGAFVTDLGESPISDWTYKWTPTIYLDDPNIANPKCSIINDSVNYVVEVTDRNSGCKAYDTVVVYTNRSIDSTAQNLRICNGDSVLFNGIQRKTTGNYYFTIKKADGFCDSFINILRLNVLQKQVIPLDTLRKCEQYIDAKGKKHTQSFIEYDTIRSKSILNCDSMVYIRHIYIYKKAYRDRPPVSGCAPFRYNGKTYTESKMRVDSLVIRNIYLPGCDTIEYINVIVFPKPKAMITPSIPNPVLYKQTVTLSASGGQRYFWLQTGSTNQDIDYKINNTQPKLFTVRVTDENECWDTVSYLVKGILPDTCYYGFPNVFSPNQDNLNDEYIPNMDECTDVIVFAIYDRWGEKVFETNQLKGWDGYFKGRPAPMGVYLYYAEFNTPWGIRKHKGTFTLMR